MYSYSTQELVEAVAICDRYFKNGDIEQFVSAMINAGHALKMFELKRYITTPALLKTIEKEETEFYEYFAEQ